MEDKLMFPSPIQKPHNPFITYDLSLAKKNCKHCYGRGVVGHITKTGVEVVCLCVRKAQARERKKARAEKNKT